MPHQALRRSFFASAAVRTRQRRKKMPGMACMTGRNVLGGALRDDPAAAVAAFRAKIENPVCRLDDLQIVFNDHYGIALIH